MLINDISKKQLNVIVNLTIDLQTVHRIEPNAIKDINFQIKDKMKANSFSSNLVFFM